MRLSIETYVDIHMKGYDRSFTQRRDITGRESAKELLLLKATLLAQTGDEEVGKYEVFQRSVVTLADGEVLRGEPRRLMSVIFGDVVPIPNLPYPQTLADVPPGWLSETFGLINAQRVHGIHQRMLAQGYTHRTSALGEVIGLNPQSAGVKVYGRDGRQQWPVLPQLPQAATAPNK